MEAWLAWFRSRALFRTSLLLLAVACTACASRGRYTRVEDLPPATPSAGEYRIKSGDLLEIRVYNEERLTARPRVRSDGRIVLTLVGEVQVKGKTLSELAQEIGQRLQRYIQNPSVTVSLEERGTLAVTVVGEVAHPGVFNLPRDSGVLQAIATARRKSSAVSRNRCKRCCNGPVPRFGPPLNTTRVGSPAVCESTTRMPGPASFSSLLPTIRSTSS